MIHRYRFFTAAVVVMSSLVIVPNATGSTVSASGNSETIGMAPGGDALRVAAGGDHTCAIVQTGAVMCWGNNRWGQLGTSVNNGNDIANPTPTLVALPGATTATAIATGRTQSCALLNNGTIACWGNNRYGQLGNAANNGTDNANPTPTLVALPAGTTATAIAVGDAHTCAVLNTGGVACWGHNRYGQLGNAANSGTDNANPTPATVALPPISTAIAITAGWGHTCVVLNAGNISCWGNNRYGQIGGATNNGTDNANPTPHTPFTGLVSQSTVAITAGANHTCALLISGFAVCWGRNRFGQLGNTSNAGTDLPNPAPGLVTDAGIAILAVTSIATGDDHTCATQPDGGVRCWGRNFSGQLGNTTNIGTDTATTAPTAVSLPTGTTGLAITAGDNHTCVALNTGALACFGHNRHGQLATTTNNNDDTANPTPAPADLATGTTTTGNAITAGDNHTCAVLNTGAVACWGYNFYGQLGNTTNAGTVNPNPTPTVVTLPGGATATAITAGQGHSCAVLNTGQVACWGHNNRGQLGNTTNSGTNNPNPTPTLVTLPGGATATAITAGQSHSCAVLNTGQVACWGVNNYGQLGIFTNSGTINPNPTPTLVSLPGGAAAAAITAGEEHTCAVLNTGAAACWGSNFYGQLGNTTNSGTFNPNPTPTLVFLGFFASATAIIAGDYHTCAVLNAGAVACWGNNEYGQLGNTTNTGTLNPNPTPAFVTLPGGATAIAITAGQSHSCAVLNTGAVACWGRNDGGQLGNTTNSGTHDPNPTPALVTLPAGATATAITAGRLYTCAVLNNGAIACWGNNRYGELGNTTSNGTGNPNPTPRAVEGLPGGPSSVVAHSGNTEVVVVWDAPPATTGVVTGYTATATPGGETCTTTGALTCTITGLTNGTSYTVAVIATHPFGPGNLSKGSAPVVPAPVPPDAPTGVTATAGNTAAIVAWDAPADDGGAAITDYVATASPGGATCNTSTLTCEITGLTNGTSYTVTVTAENDAGLSPASAPPVAVIPLTIPDPPTAVTATSGDTAASIAWTAPVSDGGLPIIGYTATAAPGGKTCTTTGALTCTITGLTNGTSYTVTVTARTDAGVSPASTPPVSVVPLTVPGAPTAVTATGGDTTATVVWVAPVSTGGSAITGYTVTATPGGKTCPPTLALTCTVTGLTNSVSYTFTVTATNAAGMSPVSVASAAVVPLAPTVKSVPPGRVFESRTGNPDFKTIDRLFEGGGRIGVRQVAEIKMTDRAGVPADAEAVFLNVVAVNPSGSGYLTVFPCGIDPPNAANVNYNAGDTAANAVLAKIGDGGKICVFTLAATDLVIDVNGYTPADAGTKSVPPGRILETRTSDPLFKTIDRLFEGGGRSAAGSITEIKVTNRGGVPADAEAVFLNVVAVGPGGYGYLTVFPCGIDPPNAANVNYSPGDVAANAVLAKIGDGGNICVYTVAETDLVIDINGYTPAGAGTKSVPPGRALETRTGRPDYTTVDGAFQGIGRSAAGSITEIKVTNRAGVPPNAEAVFLNVVAVGPGGYGYLTVFPCGIDPPNAANVNYTPGTTAANAVLAKIGTGGNICVYTVAATDLVIDINGYTPTT